MRSRETEWVERVERAEREKGKERQERGESEAKRDREIRDTDKVAAAQDDSRTHRAQLPALQSVRVGVPLATRSSHSSQTRVRTCPRSL